MDIDSVLASLKDYGLVGIVLLIFYKLMTDNIKTLEKAIQELKESIDKLREDLIRQLKV
ncbi:MAG: hypothetical protein QXQ36_07205 [Sulfolobales archaeon]